jgi:N-acyl-D-aspartate/D-glutamate deacylase
MPAIHQFRGPALAFLFLILAASPRGRASDSATFDIILRHGTILDGTGAPRFQGDVGIRGRTIAAVGNLKSDHAAIEVDATGLFVTPGFINIHSHPTAEGLLRAENMLTQGVTTEILNADGAGPTDLDSQLQGLAKAGLALNVGANIGFNSIWAQVMGPSDARPSKEAIERMRGMVKRGLEQGAWGVSAGLDYKPGYFATADEVERIVSVARPWRTVFTNHDRLTPESGYSSRVGIAETIAIGERAGLVPVITHMKAQGLEQKTAPALLRMMEEAGRRGAYTAADVYPYLAGQSGLAALIVPGWALDGGREAMLARFKNPELRARIIVEAEKAMNARFGGPQGVYASGPGTELVEAMRAFGGVSPGEALIRLLEKEDGGAILRFGVESDLVAILQHPTASVACDCGAVAGRSTHPRYYGTFPRVLGRYVRDQKIMTFEDAVRKMTGLPAATIGLVDRGLLAPGLAADITIFDPASVLDRATFEAPTEPSVGIRHVLVNGQIVLKDGVLTDKQAGTALLRTAHEPSHPLVLTGERRVRVGTSTADLEVSIDVRQSKGARSPHGVVRVTDHATHTLIEMSEPGALHTLPGWASLQGFGRVGGRPGAVTLGLEERDPMDPATGPTLTIRGEDGYTLSRPLPAKAFRLDLR